MVIPTLEMYYPGVDFWEQTRDQTMLKMEAVQRREERELVRMSSVMSGLENVNDALPRWTVDPELEKLRARVEPFDFSISAQRGIVEAVERGLVPDDVWTYQVVHAWENLLSATGDLAEWRNGQLESKQKAGQKGRARRDG